MMTPKTKQEKNYLCCDCAKAFVLRFVTSATHAKMKPLNFALGCLVATGVVGATVVVYNWWKNKEKVSSI